MAAVKKKSRVPKLLEEIVNCPYCLKKTIIHPPSNYAPVYEECQQCGKRFIVERIQDGLDLFKLEEAPCISDPECRAIEWGQGQEE